MLYFHHLPSSLVGLHSSHRLSFNVFVTAANHSGSQSERVEMLRTALVDKVGADSLAHYGVEPLSATGHGSTNGTVANGIGGDDDGMHL